MNASVLFSEVGGLVSGERKLALRKVSDGPVIGRNLADVGCGITAAKSCNASTVSRLGETEYAEVRVVVTSIVHGVPHDGSGESNLVGCGRVTVTKVDLVEA